MRIGVDATSWVNARGFGRFTRSIVQALVASDQTNEYVLFFDKTYEQCPDVPSAARHVVVNTRAAQSGAIAVDSSRAPADMLRLMRAVARERLDLFFCPSIDGYFPVLRPAARVIMIHDVIPETLGPVALPNNAARWRRRLKVWFAIRQASLIATGSTYTAAQLQRVFGISAERIAIVPMGVAEQFRPAPDVAAVRAEVARQEGIGGPFFLHVGGVGPHKNIPLLLEGFADVLRARPSADLSLVFAGRTQGGMVEGETGDVDQRVRMPDLAGRVRFLGMVSDAELVRLYQSARALVLPSIMEGFGLPALEAVCCGTHAIVTSASPLPEVLGEAALAVDPHDRAALTRQLEKVFDGDCPRVPPNLTERFSWHRSAAAAVQAFERAVVAVR